MTPNPPPPRLQVIDPAAIKHVLEHPARGTRWSLRELAPVLGCSHVTLSNLAGGSQRTISVDLAERFAEAVGCETAVLFVAPLSTDSDTTAGAA